MPALNFATFLLGISISAPVLGFLPFLASLLVVDQVPKPVKETFSPFLRATVMLLTIALRTSADFDFVKPRLIENIMS